MSYVTRIRLDDGRTVDAVLDDADERYQHHDTHGLNSLAAPRLPAWRCP